jgi:hypothetical protein
MEMYAGEQMMPDGLTRQRPKSELCVLQHSCVQPYCSHSVVEGLDLPFDDEVCQLH